MQDIQFVSQIVIQSLRENSPEFGARLKQKINNRLRDLGKNHFDEKQFGYRRFRDFLEGNFEGVINISPASDSGDIHISLIEGVDTSKWNSIPNVDADSFDLSLARNDVRLAFANPDENRKRYFFRVNPSVKHFDINGPSKERTEIESSPQDYVEIKPVSGVEQKQWMLSFFNENKNNIENSKAVEDILLKDYSTSLNVEFSKALGVFSGKWKIFRNKKFSQNILQWCSDKNIDIKLIIKNEEVLRKEADAYDLRVKDFGGSKNTKKLHGSEINPRDKASKLLDLMSEDEISQIVVPMLLSVMMVKNYNKK